MNGQTKLGDVWMKERERRKIEKQIAKLKEEADYHSLQGCGYSIAHWIVPEIKRLEDLLNED